MTEAEIGKTRNECQGLTATPEAKERHGTNTPLELSKEHVPVRNLI